ncbi:MAG: AAA family ATPase, partial [Thermodesulfobacteria bacterium]|nr:AAA family ATPase [Thermodesulfobacteriota bacterium]
YNSVLITSPGPGEGKTLTAVNLAISISRETSRTVLLIDGDMRKPAVTKYLGLPDSPGLYEHLTEGVPLNELLINPGWPRFTLLPAGNPKDYPSDILGSPAMQELIWDVKNRYPERFIIFDSPPLMLYSDGLYLARYVDSILMVAQSGKTPENALKQAVEFVKDRPFLGTVLNRVPPAQSQLYDY